MAERALILGNGGKAAAGLAAILARLGVMPDRADWKGFSPRAWRGRERPVLAILDIDDPLAPPLPAGVAAIKRLGNGVSLLALTGSRSFRNLAAALDAGADDCLPKTGPAALWERKLLRILAERRPPPATELTDEIPAALFGVFRGGSDLIRLGDIASVYPGVSPRLPRWRRLAPPDSSWRGVVDADAVDCFLSGRPRVFLSWNRLHLFRMPPPEEYDVPEKVLLRRVGPPLAAAVDRSRSPAGIGLYSIVPGDGVSAGCVACLLNSRLADFYFNRLAMNGLEGRLRLDVVRNFPVPRPAPAASAELARIAVMLAHFGPSPQTWIDRRGKVEHRERMEDIVFELYGAGQDIREELSVLHF